MRKTVLAIITILTVLATSCEEVIEIDLAANDSMFVVESVISKDSVCKASLSRTSDYFSVGQRESIEDAIITIYEGENSERLNHVGNGLYESNTITGTEKDTYEIEILHNGITYNGISTMPEQPHITELRYSISDAVSPLNPDGERVVSVICTFTDNTGHGNYYLIKFTGDNGKLIERYYLLTENESNSGSVSYENGEISFSESLFYDGNQINVKVISVDQAVYNYFLQLTDILYWKRRIIPPTPYNPVTNLSNGALGFFAAWSFDAETIILD